MWRIRRKVTVFSEKFSIILVKYISTPSENVISTSIASNSSLNSTYLMSTWPSPVFRSSFTWSASHGSFLSWHRLSLSIPFTSFTMDSSRKNGTSFTEFAWAFSCILRTESGKQLRAVRSLCFFPLARMIWKKSIGKISSGMGKRLKLTSRVEIRFIKPQLMFLLFFLSFSIEMIAQL